MLFIFLREFRDPSFEPAGWISEAFFREVFLHLTTRRCYTVVGKTADIRLPIGRHLPNYLEMARITPVEFVNASQSAGYEAGRIVTAYTNNVSVHFGDNIRAA
ncbi:hypothetical protein IWQ56_003754, partial [Coemansia nantahalensis]